MAKVALKPKPVIRTVEASPIPADGPVVAPPAVVTVRQVSAPVPDATDSAETEEALEPPRFRRAWFALVVFIGLLIIIAGYTLDSNPLRFAGIIGIMVGLLCLAHDWSPLPPKPPRAI